MRRTMEERRAELMREYLPTLPMSADVRTKRSTESGAFCSSCDSTINMESKVVQPLTKSPDQILSCKGWTLSSLLNDNKNFHAAPRISVSKVTEKLLASSDTDGIPFVIEGLQHLPGWRKELLSVDWLKDDSLLKGEFLQNLFERHTDLLPFFWTNEEVPVRNIHNNVDTTLPLSEFLERTRKSSPFVQPGGIYSLSALMKQKFKHKLCRKWKIIRERSWNSQTVDRMVAQREGCSIRTSSHYRQSIGLLAWICMFQKMTG